MVVLPLRAVGLPLVLGAVLLLAALAVLLGVARANGRLPGVPLLALGLLLNLLVVLANLGVPVRRDPGAGRDRRSSSRRPTARTPSTSWSAAAPGWGCSATGWPSAPCAPSPPTAP